MAGLSQSTDSPSGCTQIFSSFGLFFRSALILLCGVLLLLALSPLLLYRWILSKICTILRPDLTHILAIQSANFLDKQSLSQPEVWNIVLRFKVRGRLEFEAIRAKFHQKCVLAKNNGAATTLCYPELQQYVVKWAGYFFWKQEDNFKIEDHVVLKEWPKTNVPMNDEEIDAFELEYLNEPLPTKKSPWEILVIDNDGLSNTQGGQEAWFLVLFKFHHSLSDGSGIFEALVKCADQQILSPIGKKLQKINPFLKFYRTLTFPFRAAYDHAKLLKLKSVRTPWDGWTSLTTEQTKPLENPGSQNCNKLLRRHISRSNGIDVRRIKKIASRNSVSFTGALLAGISGGIRKLLLTKLAVTEIPEYIVVEMPVPIPNPHPDGLAHSVCIVSFNLPVGASNMEERLQLAEQSVKDRKNSTEPILTHFLFNLAGLISHVFPRLPLNLPPLGISNFPGPTTTLKFDGQEVYDMSYVILAMSYALLITVLSYDDSIRFYCIGLDKIFSSQSEISQLVSFIEEEFIELENIENCKAEQLNVAASDPLIC